MLYDQDHNVTLPARLQPTHAESGRPPGRSRWKLRIITALISPLLFFVLLECGLRLLHFGYPTALYVRNDAGTHYVTNPYFTWQFFPVAVATMPATDFVLARKPSNVCRIVVVGGSAAHGTPEDAFYFGRMLGVMLEHRHPDRKFEVINAAVPSISSHGVLKVMKDAAVLQPDLFVIYMGHNEVVGCYAVGTAYKEHLPRLWMIRAAIAARATRTGQLILQLIPGHGWGRSSEMLRGIAHRMDLFLDNPLPMGDPRLARAYKHLETNLNDIFTAARRAGAKVVISTVASNLTHWPPFDSQHRNELPDAELRQWQELYDAAMRELGDAEWSSALTHLRQAAAIDDRYAELHYCLAHCLLAMGDIQAAVHSFQSALELDTQRFRGVQAVNDTIRRTAEAWKAAEVRLVDAQAVFAAHAQVSGAPGPDVFCDHVHFTPAGNHLLATTFLPAVERALLPQNTATAASVPDRVPTQDEVMDEVGLTPWGRNNLDTAMTFMANAFDLSRGHKPPVGRHPRWDAPRQTPLSADEIADSARLYEEAIARRPDDIYLRWQFAQFLQSQGAWSQADEQLSMILRKIPQLWHWHTMRAAGWGARGRFREAVDCYLQAAALHPYDHKLLIQLALGLQQLGDTRTAIRYARKAVRLAPRNLPLYFTLGDILEAHQDFKSARRTYHEALELDPGNRELVRRIARLEAVPSAIPGP